MGPIDPKSHRSSSRRVAGRLLHCCGKNLSYRLLSSRFVTRLSDASHFLAGYGNVSCKRLVASIFFEPKYFERIVIVLDSSGTCRRNVSKLATADGLNQSSNPTGSRDRCEPIAKLVEIQPTSFSTPNVESWLSSSGPQGWHAFGLRRARSFRKPDGLNWQRRGCGRSDDFGVDALGLHTTNGTDHG